MVTLYFKNNLNDFNFYGYCYLAEKSNAFEYLLLYLPKEENVFTVIDKYVAAI